MLLTLPAWAEDAAPKLDSGDTAWMLTSTALVLMMTIPGLALFYAGMVRKKNILATMMQSFMITCLITVTWMIAGYSLAFTNGSAYLGDFSRLFLNGMGAGYQGPGGKTVIPSEAMAKLTCRLGPGQDYKKVALAVAAHLRAHCPDWADLTIDAEKDGAAAYAVPEDDPHLAVIERVLADVHGARPVRVGIGGTLPISSMVKEALGLETVMLSYAIADENIHAPNEFFRLQSFTEGLTAWARVLPALAGVK